MKNYQWTRLTAPAITGQTTTNNTAMTETITTNENQPKEEKIKRLIQRKLKENQDSWVNLEPPTKNLSDSEYMRAVDDYVKAVNSHLDKASVLKELLKEIETL